MDYDRRMLRDGWKNSFWHVEAMVHGNITINKGDLIFLDQVDGLRGRGTSIADNYVYPFEKVSGTTLSLSSNRSLAHQNFLGVAAHWSRSGVTEPLAVNIKGLFKYPLKNARKARVGYYVTPSGSGVTLHNQYISTSSSSTNAIGICATHADFASAVEMVMLNKVFGAVELLL